MLQHSSLGNDFSVLICAKIRCTMFKILQRCFSFHKQSVLKQQKYDSEVAQL